MLEPGVHGWLGPAALSVPAELTFTLSTLLSTLVTGGVSQWEVPVEDQWVWGRLGQGKDPLGSLPAGLP